MDLHLVLSHFVKTGAKATLAAGLLGASFYYGSKNPGFVEGVENFFSEDPSYSPLGLQSKAEIKSQINRFDQIEQYVVDSDGKHLFMLMRDGMPENQAMYDSLQERVAGLTFGDSVNHIKESFELYDLVNEKYDVNSETARVLPTPHSASLIGGAKIKESDSKTPYILGAGVLGLFAAGCLRYQHLKKNNQI